MCLYCLVSELIWYSCTVKNLQHSPAARAENSLLYTRIETFSYTTCVKKAISAQRPNGKDTFQTVKVLGKRISIDFDSFSQ